MPERGKGVMGAPAPHCPFGAKEVGQGPLLPVMPAVANAIYDAVGVRIDELRITPDKVLRALELKAAGKPARIGPEHFPAVPYPKPMIVAPPWEGGDGNETKRNDSAAVVCLQRAAHAPLVAAHTPLPQRQSQPPPPLHPSPYSPHP